ncbi:hypothetical protein FY526_29215, partial [Clostridioides difficile]
MQREHLVGEDIPNLMQLSDNTLDVFSMPVQALDYTFADLVLMHQKLTDQDSSIPIKPSDEFVIQALERCAAAIAQD